MQPRGGGKGLRRISEQLQIVSSGHRFQKRDPLPVIG